MRFLHGNLKDCLMKKLLLLSQLIIFSLQCLQARFGGNVLKQDKVTYPHGSTVNYYIVYK